MTSGPRSSRDRHVCLPHPSATPEEPLCPVPPITIGYSLSGPLAANGQTARLAHQIWQEDINARGGLLGREIELVCIDDRTDAASVPGI